MDGLRIGIDSLIHDKGRAILHNNIAGHQGMVRKPERGTGFHRDIRALQSGIAPVMGIVHVDVRGIVPFQHQSSLLHRVTSHIGVVAGQLPCAATGIVVHNSQLRRAAGTFIHKAPCECSGSGVDEPGTAGSYLTQRGLIANASPHTGAILIDDTPSEVMSIQIQQTACIAEGKGITRHAVGLELLILHEHNNG